MKMMLRISVCLLLCLFGVPTHGAAGGARVAEPEPGAGGRNSTSTSWARRPQRSRRPAALRCTLARRYERKPLPATIYEGNLSYQQMDMNGGPPTVRSGRATFTIEDDQTFSLALRDSSASPLRGTLYTVTNCGETTVVMRFIEDRRAGPASVRNVSARACRKGKDFSLTSLGGTFSFQTEGPATGGTPFQWGRCK